MDTAIDFQEAPTAAAPAIDFQPPTGDPGLAQVRARYADELNDPELIYRLYSLTHREVGSQGPEAQQAFMETAFNRATARGKTLRDTITDPHYYPGVSLRPASLSPEEFDRYQQLALNVAQGGSNISGYATGNASGHVGFAGGPQTFRAGGERFGIEGPDRNWVPYGTPVMPAEAVSGGLASAPSGEQIRQMIGEQPEAALGASRGRGATVPIYRAPTFYKGPKVPKGALAPQDAPFVPITDPNDPRLQNTPLNPTDPNAAVTTNGQYPKALPVAPGETTPIIGPAHPVIDFRPDPAPLNLPGAQVIEPPGVAPPMLAAPEGDFPRATAVIPEELGVTGFPYGGLGNPLPTPTGGVPIDFQPLPEAQQPDWTTGVGHAQGAADTTPETPVEEPPEAASIFPPELTNLLTDLWKGGVRKTAEAAIAVHPAVATLRAIPATRPIGEGLVEGGGKVAEGFVGDPDNLALIAATEGLGLVPGAVSGVASKAVSTYFAAQLASQLPEVWQAFKDAPDAKSKTAIATQGISQLLMAAAATKHAVSEGPIPGAVGPIKAEAGEAAAPPAAAAAPAAAGEFGFEEIKVPGAEAAPAAGPEAAPPLKTETAAVPAPAAAAPEVPPAAAPPAEPPGSAWKGIPFMSADRIKTGLEAMGYAPEQIEGMTRGQLDAIDWQAGTRREGAPEPAGQPAKPGDIKAAFSAAGSTDALYQKAYDALQQGKTTISGVKDPILARHQAAFDRGEISSWQDLKAAEEGGATPPEPTGPAPGVLPAPAPAAGIPSWEALIARGYSKQEAAAHIQRLKDLQGTAPAALEHPTLPRELSGAKPRYSYGNKQFQLQFESDLDKAAYISAQARRSKADARYVQFVADHTGLTEKEIRAHGEEVKARIKDRAKAGTGETLTVPNTIDTVMRRKANAEMQTQQVEQIKKLGGIDILDAVIKEGGFPARGTKGYEMLSGELRRLADAARDAKYYGQRGVLMGKLFNKSSKGTDALLLRVRGHGFDVEHPAALIDRTIKRILSGEPDMELPDKAKVLHGPAMKHSADEPGFEFAKPESVEEQKARIAAEKAAADARAIETGKADRVKYGWKQPLTGTTGDLGQGSLIGAPEDLFAPAAKPRAEGEPPTPIPKAPPPAPEQADFKFQKGEGSVAPGGTRRYTLPDETRQRFQPVETNAPGFSGLRWHVGSQTGIPVEEVHLPGVPDVAGRLPRTSGERSVRAAQTLADLHSDGLSWYRGENGAHVPIRGISDGSRIYLHADMLDGPTSKPVQLVAAHEITHVMENLHPDLYADLLKHIDTTKGGAYLERKAKNYSPEQLQHEAVADLVADTLEDPTRMRQAMGETPGLFPRLASYIRDFIDHTLRKLGLSKDAGASALVDNLKAARADVMKALQQVRERRAGEAKPTEYHYSMDEPPSQAELEAAAAGNDKEKMRGHIATVQRMTQASPDVKAMVESWYTPLELDAVNHQANASIDKLGLGPSTDLFMNSRTTDANTMALGHNLAVRLDGLGHFEDAAMVRDKMAEKLTTPAQSLWYISTIAKTSPEGLIRTAQKIMTDQVKADPEKAKLLEEIERLRAQLGKLPEDQQGPATKIVIQQIGKSTRKGQIVSPEKLNELLDKHGQGKLGPDDLAQALTKYFKIPRLTPENIAKIKAAQKMWASTPADNPLLKLKRGADMMDSVYGLVPRSIWEKIRATSVISMILHGKLPVRIGVSNAIRMAGQTLVDTIQNVPVDMGNIFRGRSTVTGAQLKGIVEGLSTPVRAYRAGYKDARLRGLATVPSFREGVRTLIDLANLTTRGLYDTSEASWSPTKGFREAIKMQQGLHTFSSRFGRLFEDAVTLIHNTVPYGFWEAGFKSSLYRQMRLARMETPTAEMIANAQIDGNKAIFYNDTAMYNSLMAVRKALDLPTAKITGGKYGVGTATIPFAKVPSALLTEGLAWTPFGLTKAGWEIVRPFVVKEPFRAKEVGDAIIKAALGTGSTMLAGYQLAKIGVLTGAPDDNRDLDAMRRASGWGGFKINVTELKRRMTSGNWWKRSATPDEGDVIVNYNWLEPIAFPLAMGADIAKSQDKREIDLKRGRITSNAVVSAMGAGLQSLTEAPMLRGVEEVIRDVGGGSWGKAATSMVANIPGNFIPSLVRQTSQYMDNTVRETRGGTLVEQEANAIMKQIPGLSKRYPARYDVFGEAMQRYNYGNASLLNVFFNPAMVSHFKTNPGMAEMQRIYEKTGSSSGMASEVPAKLMINGKQVQLTNEQVAAYQRYVGKESSAVITRLLASPQFAAEPVTIKQNVMGQVLSAVNTAAKVDLFGHAPIQAGLGLKGPVVRGPSPLEVGALLEARRRGLNRPDFVQPQPAAGNVPLWKLAPPPALPSLEP